MMIADLDKRLDKLTTTCVRIGDLRPSWTERMTNSGTILRSLSYVDLGGRPLKVTDRFMHSLAARFHIGSDCFRYFTPDEVFARVQRVHPRTFIRLTTDGDTALGMSNPVRPLVSANELLSLLDSQKDRLADLEYREGVVTSTHRLDEPRMLIGRDAFDQTCTFETPVDGFGLPSVYLSLIRMLCTNGLIGYSVAFRTMIALGKSAGDGAFGPLSRAMDCFSNEEGYVALQQRLEAARRSEASVYEVRTLAKAMERSLPTPERYRRDGVFDRLWKLTGDLSVKYGVASSQAIGTKKQRMLPMDCTVYDLLTIATEITTHRRGQLTQPRLLHAWVGQTLATEFDLENSLDGDGRSEERVTPAFFLN